MRLSHCNSSKLMMEGFIRVFFGAGNSAVAATAVVTCDR
jgi:hypothetical protein